MNAVDSTEEEEVELPDLEAGDEAKILWCVNYERFQREFRDQVIVQAVTRRIGKLTFLKSKLDCWSGGKKTIQRNSILCRNSIFSYGLLCWKQNFKSFFL